MRSAHLRCQLEIFRADNAVLGQPFQFSTVPSPRFPPSQSQSQQGVSPTAYSPAGASSHDGHKYPMAVPPTSIGQQSQSDPKTTAAQSYSPTSPQSPGTQNREQQRISLLLEINNELLQDIDRLQAEGQGGIMNPQQLQQVRSDGQPEKPASEQYINVMRRLQANLQYLMPRASQANSATPIPNNQPPGPAYLSPPPHMTALVPQYERLKALFPDWPGLEKGLEGRLAAASSSPRPNGPTAHATATPP